MKSAFEMIKMVTFLIMVKIDSLFIKEKPNSKKGSDLININIYDNLGVSKTTLPDKRNKGL